MQMAFFILTIWPNRNA